MRIRAFQALRPTPEQAPKVASLPYDVVNTEEARELAEDNPLSMLHVVRAEIDFPPGTDPYSDAVYAKAVENFRKLIDGKHLVRDGEPHLYVYEQEMKGLRQRGLVALCHVEDYENNLIKKHEKTRPDKENDRTRLTSEMSANAGPVFLTYRDVPEVNKLVERACANDPVYNFTAEDGIRHTAWLVPGGEAIVEAFQAGVPAAYVADGHHRSASAARVGKERRDNNPHHTGEEDYNWFLCVLFPSSELNILPYNRLVRDLNGLSAEDFLKNAGSAVELVGEAGPEPGAPGDIRMYVDGKWYQLKVSPAADADPVSKLDVSLLQERLLTPVLGVGDPRTDKRVEFVGGIRGTKYLEKQVDSGKFAVGFSMYPVTVQQLMEISDAGQIMAPKSTWFEPKLRSGLFIHTF